MNISEQVVDRKAPVKDLPPLKFFWGEEGTEPSFMIQCVDDDVWDEIEEASIDQDEPWKTEKVDGFRPKRVKNVDQALRARNSVKYLVKGWNGLTAEAISTVVPMTKAIATKDPKDEFEFSPANLDALGDICSPAFCIWVIRCASDMASFHAANVEEEVKNSQSTSGGTSKGAPKAASKAS